MHMIDLHLNPKHLVKHAQSGSHNRLYDEDLGYAAHAWLMATFGDISPNCFRLTETRDGELRLLGYGPASAEEMQTRASTYATPQAYAVCDWSTIASKSLAHIPLSASKVLGFEIRICPVRRGERGERDAYLAAVEASTEPSSSDRAKVYSTWLQERLSDAAAIDTSATEMTGFRLISAWRRRHDSQGRAGRGHRLTRPDALMRGRLTITDEVGFLNLLGHGIGRHRAFGFGMLLLRPA